MKRILFISVLLAGIMFSANALFAQNMPGLDKSPADISYFRTERGAAPSVKVVYSRPQKKDREIFGGIIPFGETWRTGANEATEIRFYEDVSFGGVDVKAGTYTLFTVPGEKEWVIMLNSELDQWGAYRMDASKNVARTSAKVSTADESVEAFTIAFKAVDGGAHLVMAWDQTRVEVPIMMK